MAKQIIELWIKNDTRKTYVPITVISTYKASFSNTEDGRTMSSEQIIALCYFDETGEILEYPLNETLIKTLYDEKSGESLCFSPAPYEAGEGKEDR